MEQNSDLLPRKKRKPKRKANSPLNDTNNGPEQRTQRGTQVSSRKASGKGKSVSGVKYDKNGNKIKNNLNSGTDSSVIPKNSSSGYCFTDPSGNPPIMSFSKNSVSSSPLNPHQHTGTVQGVPAMNSGTYSTSSTQSMPPQQVFNMPQPLPQVTGQPNWVAELIEDVKHIKLSMTKSESESELFTGETPN